MKAQLPDLGLTFAGAEVEVCRSVDESHVSRCLKIANGIARNERPSCKIASGSAPYQRTGRNATGDHGTAFSITLQRTVVKGGRVFRNYRLQDGGSHICTASQQQDSQKLSHTSTLASFAPARKGLS